MINIFKSPCNACEFRSSLCQSFCDEYQEWRKERDAVKKERAKYFETERMFDNIKGNRRRKK